MQQSFAATVWCEGEWFVSQCIEIGIASQGKTEKEALVNLKEALELYFENQNNNEIVISKIQPTTNNQEPTTESL